jgi:hypothetical protein
VGSVVSSEGVRDLEGPVKRWETVCQERALAAAEPPRRDERREVDFRFTAADAARRVAARFFAMVAPWGWGHYVPASM